MPSKKLHENKHSSKVIKFPTARRRDCILILGLTNSGEAAVSEGIKNIYNHKLSGNKEIKNTFNAPYEHNEIAFLNEKLLTYFGLTWDSIISLPVNWRNEINLKGDRQKLKSLLLDNFNYDGPIIINDSKLVLILPLWLELLKELDFNVKIVIVHRHPNQLATFYKEHENFSVNKSHLIYINYMKLTEKLTRNLNRVILDYDDLAKNPEKTIVNSVIDLGSKFKSNLSFDLNKITPLLEQTDISAKTLISEKEKSIVEKTSLKLSKLYQSIHHANKNNLVYSKLDSLYDSFDDEFEAFHKGILYSHNYLSKLVISFDNGTEKVLTRKIIKGRQIVSFDLKNYSDIVSISFYPSNELSFIKLGTITSNTDGEDHFIKFSSFNNILHHSNNYIVNGQNRIFIDFSTISNNIRTIDFEITLSAVGLPIMQFIQELGRKKDAWFYENLNDVNQHLRKALAEKKVINKERKKAIKQLDERILINSKQSSKIEELTMVNSDLKVGIGIKGVDDAELNQLKEKLIRSELEFNQLNEKLIQSELKFNQLNDQLLKEKETSFELVRLKKVLDENKKLVEAEQKKQLKISEALDHEKQTNKALSQQITENKKLVEAEQKKQLNINEALDHEKQTNKELSRQITENKKQYLHEQKQQKNLLAEHRIEKQITSELKSNLDRIENQLAIEKHKSGTLNKKAKQDAKRLKKLSKALASKSIALLSESKLHETSKHNNEKLNNEITEIKQNEDSLKSELNLRQMQVNNILETSEKYKAEVTTLQDESENRNKVIGKQHHEILKFKTDYAAVENYVATLKQSKSYKLGRFLTAPLRYFYDLVFESKNRFWLFLGGFLILLRYPFRFLKHANGNNIATLKNAIKNEPPKQILANFKQFLSTGQPKLVGPESQVEVVRNSNPEYMSKWDEFLKNKAISKNNARAKVLYISPELPQYDTSSGGKRATRMLGLLAQEVDVYVYTTAVKADKYINKLEENGVHVIINTDLDSLRKKITHFDSIIFAWYYTYLESHRLTELYPDAKIIVDTVDVHWVREERSIGNWEGFTPEMAAKNKEGEVYTYQQADIVWAVTENDKAAINNEIPNKDIRVISNIHSPVVSEYVDPQNNNILFFGGFSHYPNISAVKLLVQQILPLVQKEIPDCKVVIAGSKAPQEIRELGQIKGVEFKGFIEEEDVTALYQDTFLSVSPLLAGAGIKGKICEAIAYMTPVVTNALGNEGINLENEKSGFIAEDIEELARLIIKAMRREYDLATITKSAQEKMAHLIGPEIVKERMVASIIPEVTICIVTYNRMDLLKRCIESIEGNTNYPRYKIVVHSNGCTDGTAQYLEAAAVINKKIIPVLSEKNEVFVIPNNNMMMMYDQNDVILLNNDTYVTNNWLTELHNAAYSSSEIGIAGSKILYPDGKLQEFGSELYENGEGKNIGKWEDPNLDAYQKTKRAGYVSGCSMYIKRFTINKLGVFDLQFHPCYCEDSDYCYTAWENDIQTVVTPNSIVYHDEGATSGTDTSSGFKKYQDINFKKFLVKHKDKLANTQQKIEHLNGRPIDVTK